jgi:hypothetical protein
VGACFFEMGKDVRDGVLSFNAMCWTLLNSSDSLGFSLFELKGHKIKQPIWILQLPTGSHACLLACGLFWSFWSLGKSPLFL